MSKELVISSNRHETRVALIEDDQLVEVYFQRANEYSLAGSIHKGRVTRVLPGMQSAFVDVGLERDTFLYVTDFLEEHEDIDRVTGDEPLPQPRRGGRERDERGRDGRDRGRDNDRGARDGARDNDRAPQSPSAPIAAAGESQAAGEETAGDAGRTIGQDAGSAEAIAAASPDERSGGPVPFERSPGERPPGERPPERPLGERGDERDRHGRRSRRRRSRGRGFPDAKYAGAGPTGPTGSHENEGAQRAEQPAQHAEQPATQHTEHSTRGDARYFETETRTEPPLILPGESLAKYRGTPGHEPAGNTGHDRAASGNSEARREFIADASTGTGVIESDALENEFDEPSHYPPENALPDAPAHTPPTAPMTEGEEIAEPQNVAATPVRAPGTPPPLPYMTAPDIVHSEPAPSVTHDVNQVEEEIEPEEAEGGPATAPMLDEDEDRDIQEMILSHAGGIDLVDESDEAEAGGEETAGEGTSSGEASGNGASGNEASGNETNSGEARTGPENGAAQVRERGGRYPHRGMARRTRRRGRGGQEPHSGDRPPDRGPERTGDQRTVSRPISTLPSGTPLITDLLKEGQEIIVQIAKEPLGQKGARITSHIALPGRYVVFMPTLQHMGVSRKISSDEERLRLKRILQARRPGPLGGFITRTAAEGRTEEEIASDMAFLYNLWMDIRNKAEKRPAPVLLHHDLDIVQRILRDQLADNFKAIWIDNEDTYVSVLRFVEQFQPGLVGKVKLYTREAPIFDAFNVTAELEKALRPKVWLKSGGFIVINQTEALVAIDVNTGKYVGKTNRLEDTIVKTNTEAIKEIVRQIRLRDLGGIIVIDFIDMDERKNRQKVMQVLEEAMRVDRAPYKILQFNDFGLVAITRKRVKQSLERTLCSPCPHCDGAGYIKSVQTVVNEILTEARKMASSVEGKDVMLRVHPDVAKVLKSNQNKYLEELEEVLRRPVLVRSDAQLHHEKFDLA
jgi:ribonuclease G